MITIVVAALIGIAVALASAGIARPHRAASLETMSGVLLVAGLALLGFAMPIAQHLRAG